MIQPDESTVSKIIKLSRLLGEFGQIERTTKLPNGNAESDSHHSFSLALTAFELAMQFAPELDMKKILLYSLVHDLPELVTGDTNTLLATDEALDKKFLRDADALVAMRDVLSGTPSILNALEAYELKADEESLFVYWIDKIMTIPTHFYDNGQNLKSLGIADRDGIRQWYDRTLRKLGKHEQAHAAVVRILELTYKKMHDELLDE